MNNIEILRKFLCETEVSLPQTQLEQLVAFVEQIAKWNQIYNLTSVRKVEDMLLKHIVDSVVVSPYLQGDSFIDVGTGPGLPGIPLAIVNTSKEFYLLDSLTKRINFIRNVKRQLQLTNIVPVLGRCEEFTTANDAKKFDGVISRAFASLKDMLTLCDGLPNESGVYLALKGQIDKTEIDDIPKDFVVSDIIQLRVPKILGQRHLFVITKKG